MAKTVKVDLTKADLGMRIVWRIGSMVVLLFVAYMAVDARFDKLEVNDAVLQEQIKGMRTEITRVYDIVKDWSPDGQKTSVAEKEEKAHPES
jgi:hypothetical protein